MFADCLSLADSQYPILLILLILQVWMYKQHLVLQYGVIVSLFLLLIYPVFFDKMPREGFSLFFSIVLLGYLAQMIYVSVKGVRQAIAPAVLIAVYLIMFFFVSTTLNTALMFTRPVDAAVGLYKNVEGKAKLASKVYEKVKK
jgi:hypothetical protein